VAPVEECGTAVRSLKAETHLLWCPVLFLVALWLNDRGIRQSLEHFWMSNCWVVS
jgi:hypothetical protein